MKKVEAAKKNEIFDLDKVLTKEEIERLDAIFKPVIGQYFDEMGE